MGMQVGWENLFLKGFDWLWLGFVEGVAMGFTDMYQVRGGWRGLWFGAGLWESVFGFVGVVVVVTKRHCFNMPVRGAFSIVGD